MHSSRRTNMLLQTAHQIATSIFSHGARTPTGDSSSHKEVFFGAFEFEEDDSYFLGGPFSHQGKKYGLVSVRVAKALEPIETIVGSLYKEMTTGNSTTYMPHATRKRVEARYEKSDFFFDEVTKQSYSDLDLQYGSDEIDPSVKERLKKTGVCGIFFNTNGARQVISSLLTQSEINEWQNALERTAKETCEEMHKIASCVERPYQIYLYGTDDSSFTTTVATEEEWQKFLSDMKTSDFVHEHMVYTN